MRDAQDRRRPARGEDRIEQHTFQGSTRVKSASYDLDKQVVTVLFPDMVKWRYSAVDRETWSDFKRASSPGTFLRTVLDAHPNGRA